MTIKSKDVKVYLDPLNTASIRTVDFSTTDLKTLTNYCEL